MVKRIIWPLMISLLVTFPFGFTNVVAQEQVQGYVISTGDVLEITVYGEEDLTKVIRVSADGIISYPLVGEVRVMGLTPSQLEDELTYILGEDYLVNPQVNVFVKEFSSFSILGQVKNPGSYPLKGRVTVLDAIALAGGFTKIAAPNKTKIIRVEDSQEKTIGVRVNDVIKKPDQSKNILLRPNDTIIVPESFF
jgi:polysaccharide export outer membrane protein